MRTALITLVFFCAATLVACGDPDPQGLSCCAGVDTSGLDCKNVQDRLNEANINANPDPYGGPTEPILQCLGAYASECAGAELLFRCPGE